LNCDVTAEILPNLYDVSPAKLYDVNSAPNSASVTEQLLFTSDRTVAKREGPIREVRRTFEAVTKLPRKQQRKVLEMVQTLVEQYKCKAS
jgi:hypothetical protein